MILPRLLSWFAGSRVLWQKSMRPQGPCCDACEPSVACEQGVGSLGGQTQVLRTRLMAGCGGMPPHCMQEAAANPPLRELRVLSWSAYQTPLSEWVLMI